MAGKGEARRGLGFGAGVVTGLAFCAVVLSGLSLSVPMEQRGAGETPSADGLEPSGPPSGPADAGREPADEPAGADTASASSENRVLDEAVSGAAQGSGPETPAEAAAPADAPATPDTAPAPESATADGEAPEPASAPQSEAEAAVDPVDGDAPVASGEDAPVAADVAPVEEAAPAVPEADTPPQESVTVAPIGEATTDDRTDVTDEAAPLPEAAEPAPPAWRANAAVADLAPGEPVMTVVVTGARAGSLPALTTLAPLGAVTVAIDTAVEDKAGLAAALRALGHEVLETVTAAAPATDFPLTAGLAVAGGIDAAAAEALLRRAEDRGALAIDLTRAAGSPLVTAGRAEGQPVAGAALTIPAGRTASEAFQTLRDAGALAAQEGTLVVSLEASPATLTALGRWLALPGDVQPAPLTALIRRLGPTRY
jgi:hypothetical protein